jgi:hypothetical protein
MKLSPLALALLASTSALAGGSSGGDNCRSLGIENIRTKNIPQQSIQIDAEAENNIFQCSSGRFEQIRIRAFVKNKASDPRLKLSKNAKVALSFVDEIGHPSIMLLSLFTLENGNGEIHIRNEGLSKALRAKRGVTFSILDMGGFASGETHLSL